MHLLRTSALSALAALVRLVSALALNKVLAVLIGPAGFALLGHFQSVMTLIVGLSSNALSNGVTKGTAEHFDDVVRQQAIWRTAIRLSIVFCGVLALLLVSFRHELASWLFQREDLESVFLWLILALPAISANVILSAALNGKGATAAFVTASIAGNVIALAAASVLALFYGLEGALTAVAVAPAISLIVTARLISRMNWFRWSHLWGTSTKQATKELSKFAVMSLSTVLCIPTAQLIIRDHLGHTYGWAFAGCWQAVTKISDIYLMFFTMTLATYYLPRVSAIRETRELRAEIVKVYVFALPLAMVAAITIYFARDAVVTLLFTAEFAPMKQLFAWQLAGDVLKVASWILAYVLIGKAAIKAFVLGEVVFASSLVVLSVALTDRYGFPGISAAYFVNYSLYFLVMAFVVGRRLRGAGV